MNRTSSGSLGDNPVLLRIHSNQHGGYGVQGIETINNLTNIVE